VDLKVHFKVVTLAIFEPIRARRRSPEAYLRLGEITVDVVQKDIKNVHLSVYPPTGRVKISAPLRMTADTIRVFAISKIGWIKQQQGKLRGQERETPREYLDRESHYVWGKRYLLRVVEDNAAPRVEVQPKMLVLRVRPGADDTAREAVMAGWYRQLLKTAVPPLIHEWESRLDVSVARFYVQHMKTKWGSCNPVAGNIRLNTELAKKPPECLDYVVLHEMAHLLEQTHGTKFIKVMDCFMPSWRITRDLLNGLPASHERWDH
jgi:predicted metal-dependent hydrolase